MIKKHLSKSVLYGSDKFIDENVFMCLGKHISRMELKLVYDLMDEDEVDIKGMKLIKSINKYCDRSLIEMIIDGKFVSETVLLWPNLKKLKFTWYLINNQTLRLLNCPNLTHLESKNYGQNIINVPVDLANSFRNLISV